MEHHELIKIGEEYTGAWNSQQPEQVASFFSKAGSLIVNGGAPLTGRASITEFAGGFMTAFPDLNLVMDDLVVKPGEVEYHWTFTGTFSGPDGNGNKVAFSGLERWVLDEAGLIKQSIGSFDEDDYNRQLQTSHDGRE